MAERSIVVVAFLFALMMPVMSVPAKSALLTDDVKADPACLQDCHAECKQDDLACANKCNDGCRSKAAFVQASKTYNAASPAEKDFVLQALIGAGAAAGDGATAGDVPTTKVDAATADANCIKKCFQECTSDKKDTDCNAMCDKGCRSKETLVKMSAAYAAATTADRIAVFKDLFGKNGPAPAPYAA